MRRNLSAISSLAARTLELRGEGSSQGQEGLMPEFVSRSRRQLSRVVYYQIPNQGNGFM
jgi:hypothetical protein